MKILYIIQCTNLGGMEQTSSEQARLMRVHHDVEYRAISPRPPGKGAALFDRVDPAMVFGEYRGKFNMFGHRAFAAQVADLARDCDLIYVAGTCVSSLRAANATGKPVILAHHFHHGDDRRSKVKWRAFYELLCRKLKGVIYISPFTRDEGVSLAPWLKGRALVARQSIPVETLTPAQRTAERIAARTRLGLPQDAWIVGNAGWLIPRKRFDIFLEVAARVKRAVPDAHFVICGEGELSDALKAQAQALGIAGSVEFRGWVADLDDHYRAWNALLFNTDHDAVGRTALEGIAKGLNVVTSVRYGGLGEFFAEGDRGAFFSDHDIAGMAAALIKLHDDPAYAAAQSEAAMTHLAATYTPEAAIAPIRTLVFDRD